MLQKLQEIFTFDNKKMAHYILVYREPKIVYILEIIPPNYRFMLDMSAEDENVEYIIYRKAKDEKAD